MLKGHGNLARGVWRVLSGHSEWRDDFNLSAYGLKASGLAIILSWPLYLICAIAASRHSDQPSLISSAQFTVMIMVMTLSFSVIAYIICQLMSRTALFAQWVIVRHWAMLAVVTLMSFGFGLYLMGLMPFRLAYVLGITAYLGTLVMDIQIARRCVNMDWFSSIFTACVISLGSLLVLLSGFALASG